MPKTTANWYSERVERDVDLARWGTFGTPVLVFPTAGGDAEEVERFHLVDACAELVDAGRVKLYSVDSVNGRVLLAKEGDSRPPGVDPAAVLRVHPPRGRAGDPHRLRSPTTSRSGRPARRSARSTRSPACACSPTCSGAPICMSGTYDLRRFYDGPVGEDFTASSPLHFLPDLDGERARPAAPALRGARQRRGRQRGHRRVVARRPPCSAARASPTASTRGASSGTTTGRCGGRCCRSTWRTWPDDGDADGTGDDRAPDGDPLDAPRPAGARAHARRADVRDRHHPHRRRAGDVPRRRVVAARRHAPWRCSPTSPTATSRPRSGRSTSSSTSTRRSSRAPA